MIQVLQRAMDVLAAVSKEKEGFTVIQLAEQLSLNRGTCSTIVQSLVEEGYLIKLEKTRNYILGPRVYGLTRRRYFLHDLVMPAKAAVDRLGEETGLPCVLSVIFQNRYYKLYATNQELGIPPEDELVYLEDVSAKATGRALLSSLGKKELDAFLKNNPATVRNWPGDEPAAGTLKRIAREGHVIINTPEGYAALAVSAGSARGCPVALGTYLPREDATPDKLQELLALLKDRAGIIVREYGRTL